METTRKETTVKSDPGPTVGEYAAIIRAMHNHESELLNHRFQWFALLTGLLFASFGFLWEFRGSAYPLLYLISAIGCFVSLSSALASRLTSTAHDELDAKFEQFLGARKVINYDVDFPPIRGKKCKSKLNFLLPWNFIFWMFFVFWLLIGVATVYSQITGTEPLPNKASLSTPAPPRVQSAMIIQPQIHSRSLAPGQV